MLRERVSRHIDPRLKARSADMLHRARWRRSPLRPVTTAFVRRHGLVVHDGPFAGMRFPDMAVGRSTFLIPQLLGAYERELREVIDDVVDRGFEQIVDIGAAEGYYAVGLARACPASVVHAYEMDAFAAGICRALAAANGISGTLELHGECTPAALAALPARNTFVLCDVEGAEDRLMDPAAVPWLRTAMLLVELHDFAAPGIEGRIRDRFSASHRVRVIPSECRYAEDFPRVMDLPERTYADRVLAVSEFRPYRMAWAVLEPKAT
jgi:hypothetical protein